jgi:hypothetical protein
MFSVFLLFCYYLPFEKGNPLHLKKLESPSLKDNLFRVCLKVLEKKIIKLPQFLHFCDYLPFEEDLALYLNKLEFPAPKDNLY